MVPAGGFGEFGVGEVDAARRAEQQVGHGGEPERSWLPRMVAVEVRSAKRWLLHPLMRFSIPPRAQQKSS